MSTPDPQREPQSETPEKDAILKTHEEFIGDMARPSISKKDYDKRKETADQKAEKKSAENQSAPSKATPEEP